MESLERPLHAGLFAAIVVTTTGYIAENYDARLAGLVAAAPVALTATLFLQEKGDFGEWAEGFGVGLFLYFVSVATLRIMHMRGQTKSHSVLTSVAMWFFFASIYMLMR